MSQEDFKPHPNIDAKFGIDLWKKTMFAPEGIPDYTFEERYMRGTQRPSYPERDELDRLHLLRVEGLPLRADWNVVQAFLESVRSNPDKVAYIWCDENGDEESRHVYRDIYSKTRSLAAHLKNTYTFSKGDRVLLVYEPCAEFFHAFWACLLVGVIPVPVCPPDPFNLEGDHSEKLISINLDASPKAIITSSRYKDSIAAARLLYPEAYSLPKNVIMDSSKFLWIASDSLSHIPDSEFEICFDEASFAHSDPSKCRTAGVGWTPMFNPTSEELYKPQVRGVDVAFLQYTSGSTGLAKGVIVHHRTLCYNVFNCSLLTQGIGDTATYQWANGVSWLPTFHDMGLIGFHVAPIVIGGTMLYLSPIHFIQNPVSWLKMVSRCNTCFTGAPPFALDLLVKRTTDEELKQLHLDAIGALILGAEPLRASYMEAFAKKFKAAGFDPNYYVTCFGMAENILHVTGKWGIGYGVRKILVESKMLRENKLKILQADRVTLTSTSGQVLGPLDQITTKTKTITTTTTSTTSTSSTTTSSSALGDDDSGSEEESQWLVSSGEVVPFFTKQTLSAEIEDAALLKNRIPLHSRREYGSHVIAVDPNTKIELPEGQIGELWILSPSKTAGYWNRPELSQEQFHAVLAEATNQNTKDIIEWVTTVMPKRYGGHDTKGSLDPEVTGRSVAESLAALEPHSNLLTTCLSTTSMDPVTKALVFKHATTPTKDIKAEWLRTGDMGVIHDGEVYITGRIKDMIILRGQNFYADDIEHSFSTNTDDLTIAKATAAVEAAQAKSKSTRSPALTLIRPGHAIAYSIELTPTKQNDPRNDPVLKANVEGEHLCLLVELSPNVELTTSTDDDSNGKQILKLKHDENDDSQKKSGNQAPLWQRILTNYSTKIVGGMSKINSADLDNRQRNSRQTRSCGETTMAYTRSMFFGAVRMAMATGAWVSASVSPARSLPRTQTRSSNNGLSQADSDALNSISLKDEKDGQEEEGELRECDRFLPPDSETLKLRALYTQTHLNSIATAIRRIITTKFMLVVDKIVFVAPRTIRKTSSGKKRRNDTVAAFEGGYFNHRIVGTAHSKNMQMYTTLVEKDGARAAAVVTNQAKSTLSSNAATATPNRTPNRTPDLSPNSSHSKLPCPSSSASASAVGVSVSVGTQSHYAGTVGISLAGKGDKYETIPAAPISLISSSTTLMGKGTPDKAAYLAHSTTVNSATISNGFRPGPFTTGKLLPNFKTYQQQFSNQELIYTEIKTNLATANATTLDSLKTRILTLICREINEARTVQGATDDDDLFAPAEQFTFGDSGSTTLSVDYLRRVSTFSADEQAELLDEFGLDSITGFKLSKAFADEFNLPASALGPHLFLNDSTIDGVVNVLFNLIKSTAQKRIGDYEKRFKCEFGPIFTPSTEAITAVSTSTSTSTSSSLSTSAPSSQKASAVVKPTQIHTEYDQHDKTAAYVFRGSTDNSRIPYILGIGTAVPHIGAPQETVIEAMLGPMQMDEKSSERFRKIGSHSGIGTRYSVLDNLGQIFWGKEGVNQGNDEIIDVRQQVYKREAVKLSIQSAADAVRDWCGDKVYLSDAQRDAEREKKFLECQALHSNYEKVSHKSIPLFLDTTKDGVASPSKKLTEHSSSSSSSTTLTGPSPVQAELDLMKKHQEKLKTLKSFAEGDAHIVQSTSGDAAEDAKIIKLGAEVSEKLDRTITHIVAITCTGVIVPGLEFHIMKALGLPESTQRLPITFAGCFGAVSGLRTASALATENPLHRVLVVCTELCTLHMQLSDKIDNLVGSALFADGSGSFIVGCLPTPAETPIYSIDSVHGYAIPNTLHCMAWEQTQSGQVIGLAKEIASEIFGVIGDVIDDMLQFTPDPAHPEHRMAPGDCNLAIHPGGPLIINTIQGGFGLPPVDDGSTIPYSHPVAETWKILHEYGNMSSATLVYVLDRLRLQKDKVNKPTPTLAFGPGLSVECSLLHRLDGNPGDKNPKNITSE